MSKIVVGAKVKYHVINGKIDENAKSILREKMVVTEAYAKKINSQTKINQVAFVIDEDATKENNEARANAENKGGYLALSKTVEAEKEAERIKEEAKKKAEEEEKATKAAEESAKKKAAKAAK